MNSIKKIFAISIAFLLVVGCDNKTSLKTADIDLDSFEQRISYAIGADMGGNFQNIPDEIFEELNIAELEKGFYSYFINAEESSEDCQSILEMAFSSPDGIDTTKYSMKEISFCYGSVYGNALRESMASKNALDQLDPEIVRLGFANSLMGTDTIIDKYEQQKMVRDFNDDLNKIMSQDFMKEKIDQYADHVYDDGRYVLVEHEAGGEEDIDLTQEFRLIYTLVNTKGDTIISTLKGSGYTEEENSEIVNSDDIILPEAWRKASKKMKVGGDYTLYSSYELAYGKDGLQSPNPPSSYIVQPYSALIIHTKVLKQQERHTEVKESGKKVLEAAKKEPNTIVDPSGFVLTTLKEGTGKQVPKGGDVQANYILRDSDGEVVENSFSVAAMGQEAPTFSLNGVVEGWQLGIPKMKEGGRYLLVLPYDLAYGEYGNNGIRPFETLTFEIEILKAGESGELTGNAGRNRQPKEISEEELEQLQKQLEEQGSK